ncbi:hypothetical protein E1176_00230, partial [Fulvivirga sp. RKSG066]|nr:hypothetical protein [Fulvivirga aurantia]
MALKNRDLNSVLVGYFNLARIHFKADELNNAKVYLNLSDSVANAVDAKKWKIDIQEKYVEIHKQTGNYQQALHHHELYTAYKDSLLNKESLQKMADLRTEYEVGQKQAEVDLLTAEKRTQQI